MPYVAKIEDSQRVLSVTSGKRVDAYEGLARFLDDIFLERGPEALKRYIDELIIRTIRSQNMCSEFAISVGSRGIRKRHRELARGLQLLQQYKQERFPNTYIQ